MQASAQQRSGSLLGDVPWLVKNQGPDAARGVFYFIHGYEPVKPGNDDFDGAPPPVVGLNREGWDVVGAKVPYRASRALATDIPVERATKFETIVNLKTATALGIESLLLRADKVIE
jgi:hypothetical protein